MDTMPEYLRTEVLDTIEGFNRIEAEQELERYNRAVQELGENYKLDQNI